MRTFRWLSELKVLLLGATSTTTTISNTESRQSREDVEE